MATLVGELPPKERAALLRKDVFNYSLSATAEVIDSTVGRVEAALHRARANLYTVNVAPTITSLDAQEQRLFAADAECFNQRDWEALGSLQHADARLDIIGEARGDMAVLGATYHTNYDRLPWEWRLSAGLIVSEVVIIHWRKRDIK